jgi:hypothetical protein
MPCGVQPKHLVLPIMIATLDTAINRIVLMYAHTLLLVMIQLVLVKAHIVLDIHVHLILIAFQAIVIIRMELVNVQPTLVRMEVQVNIRDA